MSAWLILLVGTIVAALLLYALVLRIIWRRRETGASGQPHELITDFSPKAREAAGRTDPPSAAPELTRQLEGWGFQPVGLIGEKVTSPGMLLCPLTSLFCSLLPNQAIARCGQSADQATLALIGHMETPAILMSAFETDCVLITTVGSGDPVTESNRVKQQASTLEEAWHLHGSAVLAWEEAGHAAIRDAKKTWSMAEKGLEEFIWSTPLRVFEKEAYLQKCAFVLGGGVVSLGFGVALALWI